MAGYGSDTEFTAYTEAAGYDVPAGSIPAARQRGSAYIDGTYGARFIGKPTSGLEQEREWPRTGVPGFADDAIPKRVEHAAYEAALIELQSPGSLSIVTDPAKRVKRQKVDTVEREFFEPKETDAGASAAPVSSVIEGLLAPLLRPVGGISAILVV